MKVYAHEKGILLVGKGREVVQKLKELNKKYCSISEWIHNTIQK